MRGLKPPDGMCARLCTHLSRAILCVRPTVYTSEMPDGVCVRLCTHLSCAVMSAPTHPNRLIMRLNTCTPESSDHACARPSTHLIGFTDDFLEETATAAWYGVCGDVQMAAVGHQLRAQGRGVRMLTPT